MSHTNFTRKLTPFLPAAASVSTDPYVARGSLQKHGSARASYYLHAAVLGMLAGVGCSTLFGPIGGIVAAVALGGWGVVAAIKMYEAPNEKAQRPDTTL